MAISFVSQHRFTALVIFLCAYAAQLEGAYLLNGKRSTVGAYAYEVVPPKGMPFGGDVGKKFLTFESGALMDATGDDLGKSVGFPHNSRDVQIRTVFVDLGQVVLLESVAARSRLAAWWGISPFEVAFSQDGRTFGQTIKHKGGGRKYPHEEGLSVDCVLSMKSLKARFIRLRLSVPAWNHVQIGEVDIVASTLPGTQPPRKLDVKDIEEVVKVQTETPAVDELGQWTRDDWPGKVGGEKELIDRIRAEESRYSKIERDPNRYDRFGGDKTLGIRVEASGKWKLRKIDGRWWFITPEGNPFLMIAVDAVNISDAMNMNTIEHPEKSDMAKSFAWAPPKEGRFADCWWSPSEGILRFSFFQANLIRCFGKEGYRQTFFNLARNRLLDWGFNSLGKWNWVGEAERLDLPFILVASPRPTKGVGLPVYDGLHDPWDTHWSAAVENEVKYLASKCGNNPYYIGLTVLNESWWYAKVTGLVLKSVPACPAKKAFIEQLKKSYPTLTKLNDVCGPQWKSFDDLLAIDLNPHAEKLRKDISRFIELSSDRYYAAWRRAIDKHDPGRLLLGSSFVIWWRCCPEWVRGSGRHCDAMMLDHYSHDPDSIIRQYVKPFALPADKPVLLGEYSFTTTERGFRGAPGDVPSQKARGIAYSHLNEQLFAHPNWVGSMWFIYRDEVALGRDYDGGGESHNFGLVDICNLPYYEMIDEMKATNKRLFGIHVGK